MKEACIFCQIAESKIPAQVVYQDPEVLAFRDIHPQAPIHIQLIPRQHIDRVSELTPQNISIMGKLILAANELARQLEISEEGFRLVVNCNAGAGQSVYHLHLHLLGGRLMRWPPG